ncbi:pentatricopeptide repeat-containing protein At1g05750, chloroplastic-like [Zingiber officinale]|nr:pentatricopeptide repeat-containing protein At1g05750, chloroplastic-like [Zingiber officinale]
MAAHFVTPLPLPPSPTHLRLPLSPTASSSLPPIHNSSPRDLVSWTSAMARHARRGCLLDASHTFGAMLSAGVEPNYVTLVALVSACADFPSSPFALSLGLAIHAQALKRRRGLLRGAFFGTALTNMYAKCGNPHIAREVFDRMPVRNSVSFNTMIAGYMRNNKVGSALSLFDRMPEKDKVSWTVVINGCVKNDLLEEALDYFRAMQLHQIDADYVTILAVIAACTGLGALNHALWIHRYIKNHGLSGNIRLANSLIDMYSKCGCVDFAHQVFERILDRTLVSWNSMIVCFAVNGRSREAIEHFELMQRKGFEPDGVSFTGLLTACSHAGLVDEGLMFYETLKKSYSLQPTVEHYGCLVDLLSRAGRLEEAMSVVESMPFQPNEVIFCSLLGACRVYGHIELAERVTKYMLQLDPECDSNYILLSNTYAAFGWWDGASEIRNMMKAIGVKKTPGFSNIEIDCEIHEFVAGDKSHPQFDNIYAMLNLLHCEMEICSYNQKSTKVLTDD